MKLMMFPLLLFVSQHASGLELEVQQGVESVLLHCQVPVDVSKNSIAVWNRNEFTDPTVHMRLQSGDDLSQQNSRYKHRTWMRSDALQTGDLSLTLRNPTVSDSGTYTCIARSRGLDQSTIVIQLEVKVCC
ncbi:V-set domain containing T-cell activation inhibitor 1-like isoform X2 [Simochromis diagramma]|uniref:V-set domain containing T-cell activation inhibitor 1-like isoform X2 n=1 Tax=Simochromis diagramma TaxID=43689 RepID=UPI001A7ED67B|nr:V-set domain containing T-cell activation inhibitor 1-like isoform X2 [Simochromis diagramma]